MRVAHKTGRSQTMHPGRICAEFDLIRVLVHVHVVRVAGRPKHFRHRLVSRRWISKPGTVVLARELVEYRLADGV